MAGAGVKRIPGPAANRFKVAMAELAKDKVGKVGWFESARYNDKNATPVAYVASIHEFGTASAGRGRTTIIPPRPFFRPTIAEQGGVNGAWAQVAKVGAQNILKGSMNSKQAMDMLGLKAAGDIAKTISKIQSPPLAAATVANRQRRYSDRKTVGNLTKPLVDTGVMVSTLTHAVEDVK